MDAVSEKRTSRLAEHIFGAMNNKDIALLAPHLADDVQFDFPGTDRVKGKKRVMIFLKALLRKYPDLTFTVHDTLHAEDKTCIVWTNRGTGSSGQPYQNSGVTLVYSAADKITFISDYFKDTSFVR